MLSFHFAVCSNVEYQGKIDSFDKKKYNLKERGKKSKPMQHAGEENAHMVSIGDGLTFFVEREL